MQRRHIWILVAAITVARVAYSAWLSPYELVADEAQYWDWSRRLDWSYYTKGPGIAWLIALATRTLGHAEWAIRLPAALAFAVGMGALTLLTADALGRTRDAWRAAAVVPLIVALVPAYQLYALVMTTDPPALACWALALCAAWRAFRLEALESRPSVGPWIGLGAAVGVGFLFRYTNLLIVPGLFAFAWLVRHEVPWRRAWGRALVGGLVAIGLMTPVLVWNLQHELGGLRHLLGFLHVPGGDRVNRSMLAWSVLSVVEYPVVQMLIIGPMVGLAIAGARILKRSDQGPAHAAFARLLWCAAAPMLLVFLLASVRTTILGNWPIAAFLSLVPPAAVAVAHHAAGRWWWRATVAYGLVAVVAIHFPLWTARRPVARRYVPVHRFQGARERGDRLGEGVRRFLDDSAGRGLIVTDSHNQAGLLAYYLPGRPVVASAGRFLGRRPSPYDYFSDTDLGRASLAARPTLFIGGTVEGWRQVCDCPDLRIVDDDGPQFVTASFALRSR